MSSNSFYQEAHLFVAAVRVLTYKNNTPPNVKNIAELLNLTSESCYRIYRRLKDLEILEDIESVYQERLFIKDHLKIEEIPKEDGPSKLDCELEKFKIAKSEYSKKIESMTNEEKNRKKNLFAELEKKLKKDIEKKLEKKSSTE